EDPERDLAAVGDEDLAEHQASVRSSGRPGSSMITSSWPYSTAWPASTRLAPTMPSAGATTSWGTPSMATAPMRSPDRTRVPAFASLRGWKMPTAGDVAIARKRSAPSSPERLPDPGDGAPVPATPALPVALPEPVASRSADPGDEPFVEWGPGADLASLALRWPSKPPGAWPCPA